LFQKSKINLEDFLAYRFPGQEIVKSLGRFSRLDKVDSSINSFIISDFRGENQFIFSNDLKTTGADSYENWHYHSDIPEIIDYPKYMRNAHVFLTAMQELGMKKVVFSRVKKVSFPTKNIQLLFNSLCEKYPKAFVYLASSSLFGTWIGASPEILLEVHKQSVFTMSLAGTKALENQEDWDKKEIEEQQFVTDFILETLSEQGISDVESQGPYSFEAGPIKHLRTDISFDLGNRTTLELASALHPTPAVSGLPQALAIELIEAIENHDLNYNRFLYAGYLGLVSPEHTKLFVNLRCCQIQPDAAYLYVGGGFTKDSNIELEWQETERKSKTLLSVIQDIKLNDLK
jgi:isochorismate synthase